MDRGDGPTRHLNRGTDPEAHMHRAACLAALALILAPGPSFGQARFGPPPAVAFRQAGGFGGDAADGPIERTVRLEMEGGQKLEGTVFFQPLIVESELGRYTIRPDKIKQIQFLRRTNEEIAGLPKLPRDNQGNIVVQDRYSRTRSGALLRGKVVLTSDKEIIGDIFIPTDFELQFEFGRLTPAPDKFRILTMIDDEAPPAPAARPAAPPDAPPAPPAPNTTHGRPGATPKGRR